MRSTARLVPMTLASGVLFAVYLLIRPYGDVQPGGSMAEAFASTYWVVSHVCGALGLAAFAWLTVSLVDLDGGALARWARRSGLAGAFLVLPYYGAESMGLHALGKGALAGDTAALDLVTTVREQPLAITMFGVGLLLLAASGILLALAWQRGLGRDAGAWRWAAWPLGVLMALVLPQFSLPSGGRMAFGAVYLVAALVLAVACRRARHTLAAL